MNTRARTVVQRMKTPLKFDKKMEIEEKRSEILGSKSMDANARKALNRFVSRRERKLALQQDVDKLRKKLRHEENVHKALERAFTRPLGALPRLPPYLPSHMLELLAEVAVLEEEVVRLEEQVVNFRQGLYQEAIYISSSKKTVEQMSDLDHSFLHNSKSLSSEPANGSNPNTSMRWSPDANSHSASPSSRNSNGKRQLKKVVAEVQFGKENQSNLKNSRQSPLKRGSQSTVAISKSECPAGDGIERDNPNKLSEDLLKCLMNIFSQMSSPRNARAEEETTPSVSGSSDGSEETQTSDPYFICSEFGRRDIGPYKHLRIVQGNAIHSNLLSNSSFLHKKLKTLLRKLSMVDLSGLSHQHKLAFWINVYNSCMMNAYLEHGVPSSPEMVVTLMTKAMINVGGHLLSAMTIEHFILRLPYHLKHINRKGAKGDDVASRGVFGLEWPEPLVTFALSCGSWSSPAVRVFTAAQVENELGTAKSDYLQAAIGISTSNKLAIPKLLDWYLLDFAKDVESLMDWICLQLPSDLRKEAVSCLEMGRKNPVALPIQVLPYDFSFRYLLAP